MEQKNRAIEMLKLLKEEGYDMQDLINLLSDVEQAERKENQSDVLEKDERKTNIEWRIAQLLKKIGTPTNLLGYQYTKRAVILVYENEAILHSGITKELYPMIAEEFGTKPARVERAIRHAIETTFDRGNMEMIQQVFGAYSYHKGKTTNGEFISGLVEALKMEELE